MQTQQLEAVRAIVRHGYNMSVAAEALNRSQSGMSRQIKELEHELGVRIFARTRNSIVGLTTHGEEVLRIGQRILSDTRNLHQIRSWEAAESQGVLTVATTHVQAKYALPPIISSFTARFPGIALTLQQGDPLQCCDAVASGDADLAITTVSERFRDKVVAIPAFLLTPALFLPRKHRLVKEKVLTLARLSEFPFIAYSTSFATRLLIDAAFAEAGLRANVVCSATDADVCKTYVELGMGIAILVRFCFDPARDLKLAVRNIDTLLPPATLHVVFRKGGYLGRPLSAFVSMLAPHVSQQEIRLRMEGIETGAAAVPKRPLPRL